MEIRKFFQKLTDTYIPKIKNKEEDVDNIINKVDLLTKSILNFSIFEQLDLSDIEFEIYQQV